MHWQSIPYVFPVVASAAISAWLALSAWRRRPKPGALPFSLLMLAVAQWSLAYALELVSPNLATKLFWDNVTWLGVVSVPAAWLVFALQYSGTRFNSSGRTKWLTRRNLIFLALEPLVTLFLVWTNGLHGLINNSVTLDTSGPFPALIFTYGAWFWVNVVYSYLLLLLGTLLICSLISTFMRTASLYRGQVGALLIAVAVPWIGNALTIFGWNPFPHLDLTPFAFTITGLAFAWSLFRFRLLDIRPVAREVLIENMNDAVLVLDEQSRIVDLNPAVQRIFGRSSSELVGQPFIEIFSAFPHFVERYRKVTEVHEEIILDVDEAQHFFDLRISPLYQRNGHLTVTGHLVIMSDITERKQAERSLRESEERLRRIFEEAPIGMAIVGLDGKLLQVNKACSEMLGYSKQELSACSLSAITHPDDIGKDALLASQTLKGTIISYKVEKRYLKKNRETLWADLTATMFHDQNGQPIYELAMIENIIERKRARLLEEERRHVTYELHDGLAQVAASVHQHLQAFAGLYHPRSPEARQELYRAMELAQRSVREARRLIAGLRPTALDDFGLSTALSLMVEALRADGWTITYDETLGSERLPIAIETTLFGVAKEALTNVRKHAHTSRVNLALKRQGPAIRLEVQDWGCGFDPLSEFHEISFGEHVGLRAMRERVELVGGHFNLSSRPNVGTLVVAEVSLSTYDDRSAPYEQ